MIASGIQAACQGAGAPMAKTNAADPKKAHKAPLMSDLHRMKGAGQHDLLLWSEGFVQARGHLF